MRALVVLSLSLVAVAVGVGGCGKRHGVAVADPGSGAPVSAASASVAASAAHSSSSAGTHVAPSVAVAVAVAPTMANAPRVTFARVERSATRYDEHLAYPRFAFDDASVTRDVNGIVAAKVRRMRDDFAAELRDAQKDLGDDPPDDEPRPFLAVSCDVGWASNDLVSIGCDSYVFVGGAHGTKSYEAIDLELPSSAGSVLGAVRVLKLADVVSSSSAARTTLRATCDAEIAKRLDGEDAPDDDSPLDGAYAPIDFRTFVFTPSGLYFDFKSAFPHVVADLMHCQISYASLAAILVPGGPASRVRAGVPHVTAAPPTSVWDARAKEDESPAHP